MDTTEAAFSRPRLLQNLAALVIVIAGLKLAAPMVTLLLISLFIAMVSAPGVLWLLSKRVPPTLAAVLVMLAVIAVMLGFAALLGTSTNSFVRALPVYRAQLNDQMALVLNWLQGHNIDISALNLLKSIEPGSVMSIAGNVFTAIGGALGNSLVIMVVVIFVLLEVPGFSRKYRAAFPQSEDSMRRIGLITGNVVSYLALKTLVSAITGLLAGTLVAAAGVDFALLWGLLAFLLNYIPTFGSIIAALPPVMLALVQSGSGTALVVGLGFAVINLVMGNVVEPRLMGRSMGLSTLVVFLSLLAWGWILGTAGMFFAVPLTMALKIVLESDPDARWLAVLMGQDPGTEDVESAAAPAE
jgi:predicted PurR-regulated permease PerM